jgi:uncharacterized membrane protein
VAVAVTAEAANTRAQDAVRSLCIRVRPDVEVHLPDNCGSQSLDRRVRLGKSRRKLPAPKVPGEGLEEWGM